MIKHRFITTVPDGPEAAKVRPSNWNDSHVIEDHSISGSHLDLGIGYDKINTDIIPEGVVNRYEKAITSLGVMYLTNGESSALVSGAPVYLYGATVVKNGIGDISAAREVVGLVRDESVVVSGDGMIQTSGVLKATVAAWYVITGQLGGLVPNQIYYLDPYVPGRITTVMPLAPGQSVVEIGVAVNSLEMNIDIKYLF